MSLTIGRTSSLRVLNWNRSGDRQTIEGHIIAASASEADARRQQLQGLVDNVDEETFPITWSVDPTVDGFYRVNDVSVARADVERSRLARFSASVTRLSGGFATPNFETIETVLIRTNSHSVTAPTGIYASTYSSSSSEYSYEAFSTSGTVTSEDGDLYWRGAAVLTPSTRRWTQWVKPSDYYLGQARLEVSYGGTWYPVVGKQVPRNVGYSWRLNNGLCRAYPQEMTYSAYKFGGLTVDTYNSGAGGWEGRDFVGEYTRFSAPELTGRTGASGGAAGTSTAYSLQVLRNSPEAVVVRLTAGAGHGYVDVALRRGDHWAEVSILDPVSVASGVGCLTATASTSLTGGVKATAADTNGNKYLISCPSAVTADTANGRLTLSSATIQAATFQVTPKYDLRSFTDTGARDAFIACRTERQRAVVR